MQAPGLTQFLGQFRIVECEPGDHYETQVRCLVGQPTDKFDTVNARHYHIDNGDIGRAIFWYERALSSEPYGPYGLNVAARFYVTAGESNRMYERLLGYEALNLQILGPVIAGVYEVLGDEENAMRIRDAA